MPVAKPINGLLKAGRMEKKEERINEPVAITADVDQFHSSVQPLSCCIILHRVESLSLLVEQKFA